MIKYRYLGNGFTDRPCLPIAPEKQIAMYRSMLRIRRIEEVIESRYHENEMKTPIHLVIGQEATSVGACEAMTPKDLLFSTHRTHGNYLAKGGDLKAMMSELYCRANGCAGSKGGSMHLIDKKVGMEGTSAICGGIIPIATGAALTAQMQKSSHVVTAFVGDGAAEEGAVWESMNFAALRKLPIVYICENNFYSVCTPLDKRQPERPLFLKARAFGVRGVVVDGMDVTDVYRATQEAIQHAKSGHGPSFIEAQVYRFRGHGGSGDDSHTGYRDPAEVKVWEQYCPVTRFGHYLIQQGHLTADKIAAMEKEIAQEIQEAFEHAIQSPNPLESDLYSHVYA
jgi:TPP-dependent pyruvate/acetoin dehydrogenase alpha subunit